MSPGCGEMLVADELNSEHCLRIGGVQFLVKGELLGTGHVRTATGAFERDRFGPFLDDSSSTIDLTLHCIPDYDGVVAVDLTPYVELRSEGWWGTNHHNSTFLWDPTTSNVEVHYRPGISKPGLASVLPMGVQAALRLILSLFLHERRVGIMMHAASFVAPLSGRAYVAVGESGAGKSTLASMLTDEQRITDELVVLREGPDGWRAYSTPFGGELHFWPSPLSAPLAGGFLLQKSSTPHMEVLSAASALPTVARCATVPMGGTIHESWVFLQITDLVCSGTWRELHFSKNVQQTTALLEQAAEDDM